MADTPKTPPDAKAKAEAEARAREAGHRREQIRQAASVVRIVNHVDGDLLSATVSNDIRGFRRPSNAPVTLQIVDLNDKEVYSDSVPGGSSQWDYSLPANTLSNYIGQTVILIVSIDFYNTGLPQDSAELVVLA
jgi:hypothetical protein